MPDEQIIYEALKRVIDPELGVNIVDLGLIYGVKVAGGRVEVEMTLTSPGCPLAGLIDQLVRGAVGGVEGVNGVDLRLVWDPPWVPAMMSEEIREELGVEV